MFFSLSWIHPIRKHLLSFSSGSKPKAWLGKRFRDPFFRLWLMWDCEKPRPTSHLPITHQENAPSPIYKLWQSKGEEAPRPPSLQRSYFDSLTAFPSYLGEYPKYTRTAATSILFSLPRLVTSPKKSRINWKDFPKTWQLKHSQLPEHPFLFPSHFSWILLNYFQQFLHSSVIFFQLDLILADWYFRGIFSFLHKEASTGAQDWLLLAQGKEQSSPGTLWSLL